MALSEVRREFLTSQAVCNEHPHLPDPETETDVVKETNGMVRLECSFA